MITEKLIDLKEDIYSSIKQAETIRDSIINTPSYYDNSKGSLYKIHEDRGWNGYQFDLIKRIDRANKKGQFFKDLKKTKDLIDLWIAEQGHNFEGDE